MQHEGLFNRATAGTKRIVEKYHDTVSYALDFICDSQVRTSQPHSSQSSYSSLSLYPHPQCLRIILMYISTLYHISPYFLTGRSPYYFSLCLTSYHSPFCLSSFCLSPFCLSSFCLSSFYLSPPSS